MFRLLGLLVLVWLIIGVVAAFQRDYFTDADASCAEVGTTVLTIVAGPLNYAGVNPKTECELPQPSE